jgi:hypothetical protein
MNFPPFKYITAHANSLIVFETLTAAIEQSKRFGTSKIYRLIEVENPFAPRPAPPHPEKRGA